MRQYKDAVLIISKHDHLTAYPPVTGLDPQWAAIETEDYSFELPADEAELLARTVAPSLDPKKVKKDLLKPYQDKAAAALTELQETVDSWTRELIAARQSQWEGHQLADSMENLLLALSPVLVTLREIKDGDL